MLHHRANKFPFFSQLEDADCGPTCLKMVADHYGKRVALAELRDLCGISKVGATLRDLIVGGKKIGLECVPVRANLETLVQHAKLPCLLFWRNNHFVVLYAITERRGKRVFHVADPGFGRMRLKEEEFVSSWRENDGQGTAILLEPGPNWEAFVPREEEDAFSVRQAMNFVAQHARNYQRGIGIVTLMLLLSAATSWIAPLLVQYLVDDGVLKSDFNVVYLVILGQLAILLGQTVIRFIEGRVLARLSMNISVDIIVAFLEKLIRLPLSYFDSRVHTDLLQRIEDQSRVESFISYQLIHVIFSGVTLLVMSGLLLYYDLTVFLIFWAMTAVSIVWITFFLRQRRQLDYARFSLQSSNSNSLLEIITGMPEIKINSAQEGKLNAWKVIQHKVYQLKIRALNLNHIQIVGSQAFTQIKNIAITLISALWVMAGDMTLGTMVSITYVIGALTSPLLDIINFSRLSQDAKLSFERLEEVQKRPDENAARRALPPAEPASIRVEGLSFRYRPNDLELILSDLDVDIPVGKVTAIVGNSGSGKTTLMKLLLRFYLPESGRILLGNEDLATIDSDAWRERCGVVMQDGFIYSDTIAGNVSMEPPEELDPERVAFALRMACLDDFVDRLPQREKTMIGNAGTSVSGGQQQRILIARAIYRNPDFLFFDEATSLLDTITERRIMDNLSTFFRGKTVVVIAHRLSTVQNADQLLVLSEGQLIERGTHAELVDRRGHYFELIRNQLELSY